MTGDPGPIRSGRAGLRGVARVLDATLGAPLKRLRHDRRAGVVAALLGVAVALALPSVTNQYYLHVATLVLIYIPLALGQNLITGNSGQVSMGHAAFYGTGAYVTAILSVTFGWSAGAILVAAVLIVGALGFLVGLPAIRVSGDYLFIVTIGINLVFLDIVTQWVPVTGGPSGIPGVPLPTFGPIAITDYVGFYYLALVLGAASTVLILAIVHSRFGIIVEAVRDDPIAAQSCGLSLTRVKVAVFVIGAAIAALSGVTYAYFIGFVGPQDFGVIQSLLIFEMAILGGLGSVAGSIVGAFLMIGIPEILRPLQPYAVGLGGLIILVMMVRRPQGLLGEVRVSNLIKK
jgi:branched-chain amino acid transport system permease protein